MKRSILIIVFSLIAILISSSSSIAVDEYQYPTVIRRFNGSDTVAGTSHNITLPPGQSGALALINLNTPSVSVSITWPYGWNVIADQPATLMKMSIAYRIYNDSEDTLITILTDSTTKIAYNVLLFINANGAVAQTPVSSNSSTPNPPSFDTGISRDYMWIAFMGQTNNAFCTQQPSLYFNLQLALSNSPYAVSSCSAEKLRSTDVEDPPSFTSTAISRWAATTVAIIPSGVTTISTNTLFLIIAVVTQFVLWAISFIARYPIVSAIIGIIGIVITFGFWTELTWPLNLSFIVFNMVVMVYGMMFGEW